MIFLIACRIVTLCGPDGCEALTVCEQKPQPERICRVTVVCDVNGCQHITVCEAAA